MSVVFTVALTLLVSYLLGCFNGSVVTSHFIIRDDVRKHGSGNANQFKVWSPTFNSSIHTIIKSNRAR